jgi:YcxB-like protein
MNDQEETVEITTKLDWEDYKRFVKARNSDLVKMSPVLVWSILLSVLGLPVGFSMICQLDFSCYISLISNLLKYPQIKTGLIFFGFFLFSPHILYIIDFYTNAKKYWNSNKRIQEETKRIFSSEGIQSASNSFSGFIKWADLYEVKEYKEDLSIFISTIECHIIPKRFFKSDEDLEKVKEIIKQKVDPKKVKLLKK